MLIRIRKYILNIQTLLTLASVLFLDYRSNAQLTSATLQVQYDSAWTYKNLQLKSVVCLAELTTFLTNFP